MQEIRIPGKFLPQMFKFIRLILILILVDFHIGILIVILRFRLCDIIFAA